MKSKIFCTLEKGCELWLEADELELKVETSKLDNNIHAIFKKKGVPIFVKTESCQINSGDTVVFRVKDLDIRWKFALVDAEEYKELDC